MNYRVLKQTRFNNVPARPGEVVELDRKTASNAVRNGILEPIEPVAVNPPKNPDETAKSSTEEINQKDMDVESVDTGPEEETWEDDDEEVVEEKPEKQKDKKVKPKK